MAPQPSSPDVVLDVYLDGRLVHTLRLGPEAFARAAPDAPEAPPEEAAVPARPSRSVVAELPRSGRLRLEVVLRRQPEGDDTASPVLTSCVYDAYQGPTSLTGPVTTAVYDAPRRPPERPPDDPHIVG
jgi:hypothetical protein